VRSLKEIARERGLPESFAEPWKLPATAVQALPPEAKQGRPALAPANAPNPKLLIPKGKQRKQDKQNKQNKQNKPAPAAAR
jgi:hypothetical protein